MLVSKRQTWPFLVAGLLIEIGALYAFCRAGSVHPSTRPKQVIEGLFAVCSAAIAWYATGRYRLGGLIGVIAVLGVGVAVSFEVVGRTPFGLALGDGLPSAEGLSLLAYRILAGSAWWGVLVIVAGAFRAIIFRQTAWDGA